MDLAILETIKYIKQICKKKVSLDHILQRINETNATNIDTDTLRIDADNMLRIRIIDKDCKILKNQTDGDLIFQKKILGIQMKTKISSNS